MCNAPDFPIYDGRLVPSSEPVRCATCGGELQLVCTSNATHQTLPDRNQNRAAIARQRTVYRPKPCARCLRTFQPSGPRSLYCSRSDCAPPVPTPEYSAP